MLPRDIFYDLLDEGAPFRVVRHLLPGVVTFEFPAPRKGLVTVTCCGLETSFTGEAEAALARLNTALIEDSEINLEQPELCSYDPQSISYTVESKTQHRRFEATILRAPELVENPPVVIYEVREGRKNTLYVTMPDEDNGTVEITRVSRRAMPKWIHALIVSSGVSWTGSPDAEASFVKLYGEAALAEANAQQAMHHRDAMQALLAAKEGLFGKGPR